MEKSEDFADCFARAAVAVLETYLSEPARIGLEMKSGQEPQDIMVVIGVTGELEGRLILEMGEHAALGLCKAMNFGEAVPALNRTAKATLTEFIHMVGGQASKVLQEKGERFSMTTPTILCGLRMRNSRILASKRLPIHSEIGMFTVNIGLKEAC